MEAHRAALAAAAAAGPPLEGRTYAPEISWEPEVQAYLEAALGAEALRRISAALARPPLATCLRVNTLRTTPQVCRWSAAQTFRASVCHSEGDQPLQVVSGWSQLGPVPALNDALPSTAPCQQDLLRRLPDALTPEDRELVQQRPPFVHPQVRHAAVGLQDDGAAARWWYCRGHQLWWCCRPMGQPELCRMAPASLLIQCTRVSGQVRPCSAGLQACSDLSRCLPTCLSATSAAYPPASQLPDAIIVPGSGPHEIDYSRTGG